MKGVMQVSWLFLPGFGLGDFFGMFQNTTNNIEALWIKRSDNILLDSFYQMRNNLLFCMGRHFLLYSLAIFGY